MSSIPPFRPDPRVDTVTYPKQPSDYGDVPSRPGNSPDAAPASTISALHGQADLDTYLAQQLRPPYLSPVLLAPARFSTALEQAQHDLQCTAEQQPDAATALNRAARLLGDELDLRGLMTMYRSALLQG